MHGLLKVGQSSDEEDDVRSSSTMSIVSTTSTRRSSISSIGRQLGGAITRSGSILGKLKRSRSKNSAVDLKPTRSYKEFNDKLHPLLLSGLESLHKSSGSCFTCLARDLVAYSGVCKKFREFGIKRLYSSISLHGNECPKHKEGSRLKSLRRTLESRPEYAEWVMQLKVPEYNRDSPPAKIANLQIEIANVVSLCPNLEKLLGAQFPLELMSDELLNGLKNCKELREHLWLLSASANRAPMAEKLSGSFESFHGSWTQLQTLVITGDGTSCVAEGSIISALKLLPSLQRLMVGRLPESAFTDLALRLLPPVRSLRLEELPGVTDEAIIQYTTSRGAETLETLALINMGLKSLSTIAHVMRGLKKLWSFTLEQDATYFGSSKCPKFESDSLVSIHWDIRKAATTQSSDTTKQASDLVTSANASLAKAIKEGRFRCLRKLRAPSDEGDLQQACRPRINIARATDFILQFSDDPNSVEATTAIFLPRHALREARKRAQERASDAQNRRVKNTQKPQQPIFTIKISDQDGDVKATQVIPDPNTELGDVSSNVFYDLDPDFEDGYPTPKSSAFVGLDEVLEQWRLETDPSVYCRQSRTDKTKKIKGGNKDPSHERRSSFLKTCQLADLFGVHCWVIKSGSTC